MTKRDDAKPPPAKADPNRPPPPPMAGKIADVEPYQAPYQPPAGAQKAPEKPPVWRSDGRNTGQLAAGLAPLPKTVELELPEAREGERPPSSVPPTRELEPPPGASGLFAETTYILNEAQLRGEAPAPLSTDDVDELEGEQTDRILVPVLMDAASETDTLGDTPSPYAVDEDPTGAQPVISFYDETTAILKDRGVPEDDDR